MFVDSIALQVVRDCIQIDAIAPYDTARFYKAYLKYSYWGGGTDPRQLEAPAVERVENMGPFTLRSRELKEDLIDRDIICAIGKNYEFTAVEACAILGQLFSRQLHGQPGNLQVNGESNIIYIPGGLFNVTWDSSKRLFRGVRGWEFYCWKRCCRWSQGSRVFSRN